MKKVLFTALVALFAVAATAKNYVVKPNDWKVGDSRNYEYMVVTTDDIRKGAISMTVDSVWDDSYLMNYVCAMDTTSSGYISIKKILGDSLANEANNFTCKILLSKNGEFIRWENYSELKALFSELKGLMAALMAAAVENPKEAEGKILKEFLGFQWYMNKMFDSEKENVFSRDFVQTTQLNDVEAKVKVSAQDGKITFVLTATVPEEVIYAAFEKYLRENMNNVAKIMGVQPTMFDAKVQESLDELKSQGGAVTFKETVVFDEKTGWLILYDGVEESFNVSKGVTRVTRRTTITAK